MRSGLRRRVQRCAWSPCPRLRRRRAGGYGPRSIQSSTHFPARYRVHIRSLERRANHCTCPDFATNQLGTCKHIEAVLHHIRKRRDYESLKAQPLGRPYVHLDWDCEQAPILRLHRAGGMHPDLEALLDVHFDAGGAFRRRIPDDFLRFSETVREREDLDLGDDALTHARRLAEDASRASHAADIRERIDAAGGQLAGIRALLHPYQVEGVAFLSGRGRALLADDMGLGKTLQAIAAAYWMRQHDSVERVLVVCPASLKLQWAREIAKFTGLEAQVVQGPVETRGAQYRYPSPFHVVNYELVVRDLPIINETLRPDLLILDEAQRIKNWRTKIASAVKRVASRYAFVLTGTPLENRLEDLYSLMQVIDPRVLGPLWRYLVDFHVTDDRGKILGYRNLSELRRRLRPVMLRRDRSLVRDQLPERIVQRIDVPLSSVQEGIHDAALKAAGQLAQIMRRRPLTPSEQNRMLAALQQARMACDAAGLVDKETEESPKLDELETLLVAAGSYEERVLALVEGKRHLFDNVVDPQATEKVVSVSKRLAEILAADLVSIDAGGRETVATGEAPVAEPDTDTTVGPPEAAASEIEPFAEVDGVTSDAVASAPEAEPEQESTLAGQVDRDALVRDCIVAAQRQFGARIERILGQRGQAGGQIQPGLVLVLDRVDEDDDRTMQSLSGDMSVALIDRRTLASLHRLGAASPLAGVEPSFGNTYSSSRRRVRSACFGTTSCR